jgi:hypothetical protein
VQQRRKIQILLRQEGPLRLHRDSRIHDPGTIAMAKNHGARQQKKLAKQKAKRQEKRTSLTNRDSVDPTIRMRRAEKWPVARALMSKELWNIGIGYLVLARREGEGRLVFSTFLVDVYCLGVKDAFWRTGSSADLDDLVERIEGSQDLVPIKPECLVKILRGAVDYANALGFHPHRDFKHAAMLLQGIDPADCAEEFTYGEDGKPLYINGPNESIQEVMAILQRVRAAGGHFLLGGDPDMMPAGDDEFDDDDDNDDYGDDGDPANDIIIEPVPQSESRPATERNDAQ